MLELWTDISNNNGYNLCIQQLNGFIPPPKCTQKQKLMFFSYTLN